MNENQDIITEMIKKYFLPIYADNSTLNYEIDSFSNIRYTYLNINNNKWQYSIIDSENSIYIKLKRENKINKLLKTL